MTAGVPGARAGSFSEPAGLEGGEGETNIYNLC